jgi:hypothetical protein
LIVLSAQASRASWIIIIVENLLLCDDVESRSIFLRSQSAAAVVIEKVKNIAFATAISGARGHVALVSKI